MNPPTVMPVLIVGAGPTGMTAALELAYHGIPSIILDEDYRLSGGSRAIAFHQSAMAEWEKLGAAQAMLELGVPWWVRHTFRGRKKLYVQNFGKPEPGYLPTFINIPQYDVERILLERINASPFVELRWDNKVTGFSQNAGSVTLNLETPKGRSKLSAQYVLACDGARSTMRKLLNLDFPGRTFDDLFLIADIKAELDLPKEPRFFFDHPTNPGRTILIHPQPAGIWRIDWQIGSKVEPETESALEKMDVRIKSLIGDTRYEIVWLSTYRFHQRLLKQFRHGRVFFAGDSAHLVAPFGARGLNSAVQDVENLCWKLAWVLKGLAPQSLLDTYQLERHPAQAENQRVTTRTMSFMAPDTPWLRIRRNAILFLSGFYWPARKWVDSGKMSIPFTYRGSPLQSPDIPGETWNKAPLPGAKLPDLKLTLHNTGARTEVQLRRLFGKEFVALYYSRNEREAAEFLRQSGENRLRIPLKAYVILKKAGKDIPAILDERQKLSRLLGAKAGTLYLVRPDGHLALRRKNGSVQDLIGYMREPGRFE